MRRLGRRPGVGRRGRGRGPIGLAWSRDLRTWTRHPGNPVLPHGPDGAWDGRFASDPIVFREGDLHVMFYHGFDGRHARDGLAASRPTWGGRAR